MRIIHVINSLDDGGAEGALFRLVINNHESENIVVSLRDIGKYGPLLKKNKIEVHTLEMQNNFGFFKGAYKLFFLFKNSKPDVVQTWMPHSDLLGGIIGKFAGVKKIFWGIRHSNLDYIKKNKRTRYLIKINSFLSRFIPSGIVSCADTAEKYHRGIGFSSRNMTVIPNGFDFSYLKINNKFTKEFRSLNNIRNDVFLIGMVARYDPQKDHKNLLEALKIILNQKVNFLCILVGKGLTIDNIEMLEQAKQMGVSENLLLFGQTENINYIMNVIDLHVLSSSYGEAFPNVIIESMACGTPCVATDVGDSRQMIGNLGWIVNPKNPNQMANAIIDAYSNWKLGKDKENAKILRSFVKNKYSIGKMVNSFNNIWQS